MGDGVFDTDTLIGLFGEGTSEESYINFIKTLEIEHGEKVAQFFSRNIEATDGEFYFNEPTMFAALYLLIESAKRG